MPLKRGMILKLRHFVVSSALLMLFFSTWGHANSYGFNIQRAELLRDESGKEYVLDADIDYRFSEPAIDALRNGVSLGLVLHLTIKQESGWWWEGALLDEKISYRICYHSLSKLYQIIYENNDLPRNFVSFNALLETMGSIRGLPMLQSSLLLQGERYRASLTVGLDIESLPLPLRPVAYVTPAWHLASPQYKWTFVN
jgi:hypothetical protein